MNTKRTRKTPPKQENCPMCGLPSVDESPAVYCCPKCGSEAFDCCIGGNGCICIECEGAEEED